MEFLLCQLQKEEKCIEIKLEDNEFTIAAKFKQDLGDIALRMSIFKVEGDMRVVEFTKTEGNLMTYYDKVKELKSKLLSPLDEHYQKKGEEEEEK